MKGEWIGDTECDFCKKECATTGYLYDGQTMYRGSWATMCATCYPIHANLAGIYKKYKAQKILGRIKFIKE